MVGVYWAKLSGTKHSKALSELELHISPASRLKSDLSLTSGLSGAKDNKVIHKFGDFKSYTPILTTSTKDYNQINCR